MRARSTLFGPNALPDNDRVGRARTQPCLPMKRKPKATLVIAFLLAQLKTS
jgi:hypothetical protein